MRPSVSTRLRNVRDLRRTVVQVTSTVAFVSPVQPAWNRVTRVCVCEKFPDSISIVNVTLSFVQLRLHVAQSLCVKYAYPISARLVARVSRVILRARCVHATLCELATWNKEARWKFVTSNVFCRNLLNDAANVRWTRPEYRAVGLSHFVRRYQNDYRPSFNRFHYMCVVNTRCSFVAEC